VTQYADRLSARRTLEAPTECPGCGRGSWTRLRSYIAQDSDPPTKRGLLERGDELGFELCASCGLVFVSPRYSADTLARFYGVPLAQRDRAQRPPDSDTNARYPRRERARWARLARLVRRHCPEPELVVDVGAADGASLRPFLESGARAVAIDPSLDTASLETRTTTAFETRPNLDALKAEGLRPDVVLSTQTFEHLLAPRLMARTAIETIGADGVLVVEVPYDLQWMDFVTDPGKPVQIRHGGHINFFTSDSLARMAPSWGANVVEVSVGAQIKKYGGLVPSITLVARPRGAAPRAQNNGTLGPPDPLVDTLERDRLTVRRAQQRERALGILGRRGRW
jgi:hypothetical protein